MSSTNKVLPLTFFISIFNYTKINKKISKRAFSLIEIMVAIIILGAGLLIVAATFPVGLTQSRIIAEQTIAPHAKKNAILLLRRFYNNDHVLVNGMSFRTSLINSAYQLHKDAKEFNNLYFNLTEYVDINEWLQDWRVYPSTTLKNKEHFYTWSIIFRKCEYLPFSGKKIQVTIFVNRNSWQLPSFVQFGSSSFDTNDNTILLNNSINPSSTSISHFSENNYLVKEDGFIYRILSINKQKISLNFHPIDHPSPFKDYIPTNDPVFWYIPVNSNTGQSPCINVYNETICDY